MNNTFKMTLAGLMLVAAPALSLAADVSDAAGFFSPAAIEKANQAIRGIETRTGHEIRIETHATVPADKVDAVKKMTHEQQQKFTHEWVKARAHELHEQGALILICKDPARIEPYIGQKLRDAGFIKTDFEAVRDTMTSGFKHKDFDGALEQTITRLGETFDRIRSVTANPHALNRNQPAHLPPAQVHHVPPQQPQSSWLGVVVILGMVMFVIFVISMLSRAFGGGGYAGGGYGAPGYGAPGYGYGYGSGGGFWNGLAGGIFGAMAGNWLYDSFSGHSAHAHDSSMPTSSSDPLSGSRTLGDDSSTSQSDGNDGTFSGGSWFDGSSGGDSGGGGGDWGGGGGGDWGGGGGDWGGGDSGGGGGDF